MLPSAATEVSLNGGQVRVRTETAIGSDWLESKPMRLEGIDDNAAVSDHQFLIDWVNAQNLVDPLVCLGDGDPGVWKLVSQLATPQTRRAILAWDHLCEQLDQVGGSLKLLKPAKSD